jgi:hypothetical protein
VRPCETCQCFVPFAVEQCPRCGAALERIEVHEEVVERHLMLVGAGAGNGSGNGNGSADGVYSRVSLPPIDGPAGRPKQPTLPKLPQPFSPDPVALGVFLGVPPVGANGAEPAPSLTLVPEAKAGPALAADTFSALLGSPAEDPMPARPVPPVRVAPPNVPGPARPVEPSTPTVVATPVAKLNPFTEPVALPVRRSRFSRRDPFTKRRTRRERLLARLCTVLAIALPLVVVVLRLPLGVRPELGATVVRENVGVATPVTTAPATDPLDDGLALRTRADVRDTLAATESIFPTFKTYAVATPVVMRRALPNLDFVSGKHSSSRVGEVSLAGSADSIVLAEFAGPYECLFARVVNHQPPEAVAGPTGGPCIATAAPGDGWNPLGSD